MPQFELACSTGVAQSRPLAEAFDAIRNLGIENADILAIENWSHLNPSSLLGKAHEKAARISHLAADRGLKLIALNTNVPKPLVDPTGANRDYNRRVMEASLDFASACGIGVVTMDPGRQADGLSFEESFRLAKNELTHFVGLARDRGIILTIETHWHSLAEKPEHALQFVEEVPGLKLTYDPSHYIPAGVPLDETLPLLPHAAHVHIRNARADSYQERMEEKYLDLDWFKQALQSAGYTRYVSLEYLEKIARKEGYDAIEESRILKKLLEQE